MALKLKVIKFKEFEAKGIKHTHYSAAYKGRIFGVSTMRFEGNEDMIKVEGDILTLSDDIEVLRNVSTDPLTGKTASFLDIVPKAGLTLADF